VDAAINNGGHAQILGGPNHAAAESLVLGDNQGNSGSVTIDGDGSAVLDVGGSCRGTIYIGNRGSGNLTITGQGYIRSRYAYVAAVANPTRPTASGKVTVKGPGAVWYLYDYYADPGCSGAGLFIGCTANTNIGGTGIVDVADAGTIAVTSLDGATAVKVGLSGTLTGHGLVYIGGVSKAAEVHGTLAPTGALEIRGNLNLELSANTVFNVTPQA
jgi:T5SS/PEP-CTERM-associated repeat protein